MLNAHALSFWSSKAVGRRSIAAAYTLVREEGVSVGLKGVPLSSR